MILVKTCLFEKRRKVNKKREAKEFGKTLNSPDFRRIIERLGTHPFEIRGKKKPPSKKWREAIPKTDYIFCSMGRIKMIIAKPTLHSDNVFTTLQKQLQLKIDEFQD